MGDPRYNGGEQLHIHDEGARRLVLDGQEENALQPDFGDGHPLTAQPPPGTVGGPPAGAAAVTTERSAAGGGGPATSEEMPATDIPAQNVPTPHG